MKEQKPRKLTILSAFFTPFTSGAEMCAQELAHYLGTERRDDFEVTIVTGLYDAKLPRTEDYFGARIIRVGVGHKVIDKLFYPFFALPAVLRSKPVIAHAIMESYAGIALWLLSIVRPSIKRLLTLQSGDLDEKAGKSIPQFLWKLIHTSPHHVTAISQFLRERAELLRHEDVSLIYNGVHLDELYTIARNTSPLTDGVTHIGCLARLSPEKGVQDLLEAFLKVVQKNPAVHLHLVGDGVMREEFTSFIATHHLEQKVTLHGRLAHDRAMTVLAACHFVVVPSRAEGLGIAAIEALALGKPIVATRVGGLPDVVLPSVGVLVPPQDISQLCDAILLMTERQYRDNYTAQTQVVAARFSWDIIFPQFDAVYEKLLQPRITVATGIYPPEKGGPATYVPRVVAYFKTKGVAVDVITYGDDDTVRDSGVTVIYRGIFSKIRYFLGVLRMAYRADLVYVQDTVSSGFPVFLVCWLLRKPYVLKVVGFQGYEKAYREGKTQATLEDFFQEKHDFIISLVTKLGLMVVAHARHIITPSNYLKEIVVSWGISPDKISVVYNGVALPDTEEAIPHFPEGKVILMYGRMVAHKGFEELIDAVVTLHEQGVTTPFVILGSGPYYATVASYIAEKKAASFIHLLGEANREQVLFALNRARVLVNNSSYEGLSHVLLEGRLAHVPLLASKAGGNVELIVDGVHGFLYELHDVVKLRTYLMQLCTDDALYERMRYTNDTNEFSHVTMCEKTVSVLYACLTD